MVENRPTPWVEKFRPRKLSDISSQTEVVKTLASAIQSQNLPHLLFYGPAGTGKTSVILAAARELFGADFRKTGRVLELNASDERGISVVREKIKMFAQGAVGKNGGIGRNLPSFKLIILDEADSMTSDAQSCLRRMIEKYSKVTRFCLLCNYVSRIISPIASRCAKFRFQPLDSCAIRSRLVVIAEKENMGKLKDEMFDTILEASEGDMRKAINLLQSAAIVANQMDNDTEFIVNQIVEMAGMVLPSVLDALWAAIRGNVFNQLSKAVDNLVYSGYPTLTLLKQMLKEVLVSSNDKLSDSKKSKICIKFAVTDKKILDGANEALQLLDVSSNIMSIWHS